MDDQERYVREVEVEEKGADAETVALSLFRQFEPITRYKNPLSEPVWYIFITDRLNSTCYCDETILLSHDGCTIARSSWNIDGYGI